MLWGIVLVCGLAGDRIETTIAKRMNIFMAPILTMLLWSRITVYMLCFQYDL